MKTSRETITIKSTVTIRKDMWDELVKYMGDEPHIKSKTVYEALRRWWYERKQKRTKIITEEQYKWLMWPN
jgi:hypothetical protein